MNIKRNILLFFLCFITLKSYSQNIGQIDSIIKIESLNIYGMFPPFLTKDSIPNKFSEVDKNKLGRHCYAIVNDIDKANAYILNEKIPSFLFKMKKGSDENLYGNYCLLDLDQKDSIFKYTFPNLILTTQLPGIVFKNRFSEYTLLIRVSKNGDAWPRSRKIDTPDGVVALPQMDLKSILNNDISEILLFDSKFNLKSAIIFSDQKPVVFSFGNTIKKYPLNKKGNKFIFNLKTEDIVALYEKCVNKGTQSNLSSIDNQSILTWQQ